MTDDEAFLAAIQADPDDDTARLVYADWLDERGDPKGEYLRVEAELNRTAPGTERFDRLQQRLEQLMIAVGNRHWIADVARTRVSVCNRSLNVKFRCPNRWFELQPTDQPTTRYCTDCRQTVFFCESLGEALYHAEWGRCVALDASKDAECDLELKEQYGTARVVESDELLMGLISAFPRSHRLSKEKQQRFQHRQELADHWVRENVSTDVSEKP